VDANTLVFGSMAVFSLAIFFYLGQFKASKKQTERDDRIDWSVRNFSIWKILLYSLVLVGGIVLVLQFL
jgi:hypothetical protein